MLVNFYGFCVHLVCTDMQIKKDGGAEVIFFGVNGV